MQPSEPTRGQLERSLSQALQSFYGDQLGHRPSKITCHIFEEKIAIVLEEAITPPEQILANAGQEGLAAQVRFDLEKALKPQLICLIEQIVGVTVTDLLSDATLETERTGMIAILETTPQVREPSDRRLKKQAETVVDTGEA